MSGRRLRQVVDTLKLVGGDVRAKARASAERLAHGLARLRAAHAVDHGRKPAGVEGGAERVVCGVRGLDGRPQLLAQLLVRGQELLHSPRAGVIAAIGTQVGAQHVLCAVLVTLPGRHGLEVCKARHARCGLLQGVLDKALQGNGFCLVVNACGVRGGVHEGITPRETLSVEGDGDVR